MFKLTKKTLVYFSAAVSLVFFLFVLTPAIKGIFLSAVKEPLNLFTLLKREAGALIFYRSNFTQNQRFKKELDFLKQKLNSLNEEHLENLRLKKMLALKTQASYKVIAARVIARAADSWSSVVIIDKGSFHGVKRGMFVVTYLGLAGRVTETAEYSAKITLLNDPNFSISAIVQRSRQEGLVCGSLGSRLIMRYLSEEADIKIGDKIVTSGLNPACPKGLLVGRVAEIGKEFSGLSRYALIEPAVRLSDIEEALAVVP